MVGRPTSFTTDIAERICDEIADGKSLRTICKSDEFPARRTVLYWLANPDNVAFVRQYERAREAAADCFAEDIIEIADQARNKDDAPAIKVRIDARIWAASKLRPKVYGNHQAVALTGNEGGPIQVIIQGDDAGL